MMFSACGTSAPKTDFADPGEVVEATRAAHPFDEANVSEWYMELEGKTLTFKATEDVDVRTEDPKDGIVCIPYDKSYGGNMIEVHLNIPSSGSTMEYKCREGETLVVEITDVMHRKITKNGDTAMYYIRVKLPD
ncbi:MAG: hypothetical protein IJ080_04165 [Oscillospiraceae bacterium]|nr:hypothetical protein [Oscillospiraceae bacterium]MBQ8978944.1 hypothetical protein [Oscillospiraceae bacterium]